MSRNAAADPKYTAWPVKSSGTPASGQIAQDPEDKIQATRTAQLAAGGTVTGIH